MEQGYAPVNSPPASNPPRGGSATAKPPRTQRRMVKCYFVNAEPNATCIGYVSENFAVPQGSVTYFEEWFLLPMRFSPRRKSRSRIVDESRRAMSASMSKATWPARQAAYRFYPEAVVAV